MSSRILAATLGVVGLGLVVLAVSSSSTDAVARYPTVGWLVGQEDAIRLGYQELDAKVDRLKQAAKAAAASEPANTAKTVAPPAKPATPTPAPAAKATPAAAVAKPAAAPAAKPPAKPVATPIAGARAPANSPKTPVPAPGAAPAAATPAAANIPDAGANAAAANGGEPAKPAAEPAASEGGIGTLSISSSPAGAAIFLDNVNVGHTPMELDVAEGTHQLRFLQNADGTEKHETVKVKAGSTAKVNVSF